MPEEPDSDTSLKKSLFELRSYSAETCEESNRNLVNARPVCLVWFNVPVGDHRRVPAKQLETLAPLALNDEKWVDMYEYEWFAQRDGKGRKGFIWQHEP